jgi:hypothetical protein
MKFATLCVLLAGCGSDKPAQAWSGVMERAPARQAGDGRVQRVPGTHHRIAEERADIVAAAIREILTRQ